MVCFGFCLSVKAQQVCHWGFKNLRSRSSIVSWEKKSWVFMGEGLISRWGNLLKGQQANLNATNYQTSIFRHSTNSLSNISLTIGIYCHLRFRIEMSDKKRGIFMLFFLHTNSTAIFVGKVFYPQILWKIWKSWLLFHFSCKKRIRRNSEFYIK